MITPVPLTPELLLANLKANPHPKQTHLEMAGGFAYITINGHKIAYDGERWFACGEQITPQFGMNSLHQEIDRVFGLALKIKDHVLDKTTTPSWQEIKADCVGPDLPTEQTFVSTDRYRELEAELVKVTASRDESQKRITSIKGELSDACAQIYDAGKSIDRLAGECDRLKSKADRAGLLSVVCRRLCGDENASIETVHKALDLFDDQRNALDYIGRSVYCDADDAAPHRLQSIGRLAAQMSTSLSEKTAEVAKLQEGIKNYKAQVDGLTKRLEQMTFERDTERVGKKWLSETVEELKATTVKLPNEHTLRRLFSRHNTPDKYDDGTAIPTIERFLLIIENLCRNADCAERRFEELNAISTRVNTESEDAHATLDEMNIPRWTTANNHNERYLSLSARIRSVFQTHTKA